MLELLEWTVPKRSVRRPPRRSAATESPEKPTGASPSALCEAEVLRGLKPFATRELVGIEELTLQDTKDEEAQQFRYAGSLTALQRLRTVVAVYLVQPFAVSRPKALLGHEHFKVLLELLQQVQRYDPEQHFDGFRFSAAGSDSAVFARLATELARASGLRYDPTAGELLLRVRRVSAGWEVLARLTPRPLSARSWRVCNRAGGLNATVAAALWQLAGIKESDRVLNAMCGSGTLLIERQLFGAAARLVGVDIDEGALECTQQNLEAAGLGVAELVHADATALDMPAASFDVIVADVPWGDAVGSHEDNAQLYPVFLAEMARVATPQARLALLTHDMKLFEGALVRQREWQLVKTVQVYHGGHYPKIYLLNRDNAQRSR